MNRTLFFLVLVFVLSACQPVAKYRLVVRPLDESVALETVKTALEERLKQAACSNTNMRLNEKHRKIEINTSLRDTIVEPGRIQYLLSNHSFAIWPTYRISDAPIKALMDSLSQLDIANFEWFDEANATSYANQNTLGWCKEPKDFETITQVLYRNMPKHLGVKLLWSVAMDESKKAYALHVINTQQMAPITEQAIKKAEAVDDPMMGYAAIIRIELKAEAIDRWAEMTRIAAEDNNRTLALVFDERVYSLPIVRESITGGQAQLTGNFTEQEAAYMAEFMRLGTIKYAVEILSEQIIRAQ